MFGNYDNIKEKINKAENNEELYEILVKDKEGEKYIGADYINYICKENENLIDSIFKLIENVKKALTILECKCKECPENSTLHREEIEVFSEKRMNINRGIRMLVLKKYSIAEIKKLLKIRDDIDERFGELNNKTVEYRRAMED